MDKIFDWQHHFTPQEIYDRGRGQKAQPSQPRYDEKGRVTSMSGVVGFGQIWAVFRLLMSLLVRTLPNILINFTLTWLVMKVV